MGKLLSPKDERWLSELKGWWIKNRSMFAKPKTIAPRKKAEGVILGWAQAPAGGVPAAVDPSPSAEVDCELLIESPESQTGIAVDDFVKDNRSGTVVTVRVKNRWNAIAGADGNRKIQIRRNVDAAESDLWEVHDWECENTGDPNDFKELT